MDKEIPDIETAQGGATKVAAGDKVHVYRGVNSRVATLDAQLPATPASSSGPASMEFAEDTDNGSNKVTLQAPASLAGDVAVVLPGAAGTLALTDDLGMSTQERRNALLRACGIAKALAGYQRDLDTIACGFKASGDADATSAGGAVDTSAGAWKPTAITPTIVSGGTGTAVGSITGGGGLSVAFNGVTSTAFTSCAYQATSTSGYNNTIGKDWGGGNTKTIGRFIVYASSDFGVLGVGGGSTLKLQGSNDGSSWTDLYTSGTVLASAGSTVDVSSGIIVSTAYRHHRVNINGNGSNSIGVAEVVFYEGITGATNGNLITPYQTADAARTKVRGIFEIDPVDAVTLGTDLTVEYTCNGGTNWAAASTYTNCGKGQSGRTVFETEEVTCTSGTSFAARFKNLNNKNVHVHKAALKAAA